MADKVVDPDLYKKLIQPFPNQEKADRNLNGFWKEFRALRKKYRIPNAVVIYQAFVKEGDDNKTLCGYMSCGDSRLVLPLLERAYTDEYTKQTRVVAMDLRESVVFMLASSGWGSVGEARAYVESGKVKINGEVIHQDQALPDEAHVLSILNPDTNEWFDIDVPDSPIKPAAEPTG